MTRRPDPGRSPEERVRGAVRELPPAAPDPAFRARLAREFATGEIERRAALAPAPGVAERVRAWLGGPGGWATGLAAAAAVVALVVLAPEGGGDGPVVTRSTATGTVVADGRAIPLSEYREAGRRLPADGRVRVVEGVLEVEWPGVLSMGVQPGSEVALGAPAADVDLGVEVAGGEALFVTGPGFPGSRLRVTTPEGRVEVVGTAFAVLRADMGTCVCVLEGRASVGMDEADLEPIPPGRRKVMPAGGGAPEILDIMPEHRETLAEFAERVRAGP